MNRNGHWNGRGKARGATRRGRAAAEFVQLGNAPGRGGERSFSGTSRGHFPSNGGPDTADRQGAQDTAAPSIRVHGMVLPSRRKTRRHPDPLRNTPRVRNSSAEGLSGGGAGRPVFGRGLGPNSRP